MREKLNSWQDKLDREREEFARYWDWQRVVRSWRTRIEELGITLDPLFLPIHVCDPGNPIGRESDISWWPTNAVREQQKELQKFYDRHPGRIGPIHGYRETRKGELETANYLYECRNDPQGVIAVLIMASLFPRMESSRRSYPETWPKHWCVDTLRRQANEYLEKIGLQYGWHYSCTDVIPYRNNDYDYDIREFDGLIRYLAEEHAALFHAYRLVVIEFKEAPDVFIAKALAEEHKIQKERKEQWELEHAKEVQRRQEELKQFQQAHPLADKWTQISKKELTQLVWSKPTVELAKEFGISDVAIAKRCKAMGVEKPPKGFWAKVAAGVIPHPKGVPLNNSTN
jgi:hypothetical protein